MDKSPDAFRTISEVADFLETPAHVLRFWESRFPQIKPVKRAGGRRYYRPADVALLAGIRQLLHQDGMTIRGVQKILRDHGVRHVINLSDPNFSEPLETDGGVLEDSSADLPQVPPALEDEPNNIVSLTEWRPSEDAAPVSPETQAMGEAAALDGAIEAPLAAPEAGASLAAEPEIMPRTAPVNNMPEGDELPLQWSLFDLDPEPLPHNDGGEDRAVAILSDDLADSIAQHTDLGAALSASTPLSLSEQSGTDSQVPEAEPHASPVPEMASLTAEAPPPLIDDAATLSPISTAEDGLSARDRPWLPPRLRALQTQDPSTRQALPRAELLALLQRARRLLGGLKDGAQIPRG